MASNIPKNQELVLEFADKAENQDGVLKFPILWSTDKNEHYRYWQLYVGIQDSRGEKINVDQEYINRKHVPGHFGVYWTESGVENTKNPIVSEKTIIKEGKNSGKNNYTTPFTQALLDARTDFNNKIRKGNTIDKSQLSMPGELVRFEELMKRNRGPKPWRVFAMALHDINKNNNWRHIRFPCKIQPKLDGTLFIVVHSPELPESEIKISGQATPGQATSGPESKIQKVRLDWYSRGRENIDGQDHILSELYPVLKKYPGLHLVGELWKKGFGLQEISGISRRQLESSIKNTEIRLDYNIFDCFYTDSSPPFEEREAILSDIYCDIDELYGSNSYIKLVSTYETQTKEETLQKYHEFLDAGFEGAVIRNLDSKYEVGIDGEIRSYGTLKLKPRPDAEFPIIGFKEGKGKETGAVIWICSENQAGYESRTGKKFNPENPDLKTFSVTPNMEYEKRYRIYDKLKSDPEFFNKFIKNQLITISYSVLSKDLLPQQPKMLRFRDSDIDRLVSEL